MRIALLYNLLMTSSEPGHVLFSLLARHIQSTLLYLAVASIKHKVVAIF